tara:strand:+ start:8795 stop:9385 length:591 start_codon:yes stop_codon:yes gene_type:complete
MIATMIHFESHFPLKNTRTHEVCGASAHAFAFALAGQLCSANGRTALWVREAWDGHQINPVGFSSYLDPKHLLIAQAPSHIDVLASTEEALRSGHVALVIAQITQPIGLTEGRRLQLAAQAGNATGLCILPEGMGNNAAQTRWHCAPVFDESNAAEDSTLQSWKLIKNKSGTLSAWTVKWNAQTRRISVVSPPIQR